MDTNFNYYDYQFPQLNNYKEAEAYYNSVKPIRGPLRGHLDLRPLGKRRDYSYIRKDGDVYTAFHTYKFSTWSVRNNSDYHWNETKVSYHPDGSVVVDKGKYNCESNALISMVLPHGLQLCRITSKMYIKDVNRNNFYFLPMCRDVTFKRGKNGWRCVTPVREYRVRLKKRENQRIKQTLKDYYEWAKPLWPLIPDFDDRIPSFPSKYDRFRLAQELTATKTVDSLRDIKLSGRRVEYRRNIGAYGSYVRLPFMFSDFRSWSRAVLRKKMTEKLPSGAFVREPVPIGVSLPRYATMQNVAVAEHA